MCIQSFTLAYLSTVHDCTITVVEQPNPHVRFRAKTAEADKVPADCGSSYNVCLHISTFGHVFAQKLFHSSLSFSSPDKS